MDLYLFIQTEPGLATTVMNTLTESKAVTRAASVTGAFDVFARIDDVDFDELTTRLVDRVQRTPGVVRTITAAGLSAEVMSIWPVPTMPLRVDPALPQALVFVRLQPGSGTVAVERLAHSKSVLSFALLTGEYDAVMQVSGRTIEDIAKKVLRDIQTVPGVVSTSTSLVAAVTPLPGRGRRKTNVTRTRVKRPIKRPAKKSRRPKR